MGLPPGVVPVISIVDSMTTMASATLTAETTGTTLTANCSDIASNPAGSVMFGPIMIDTTPPVLTVAATANNVPYTAGTWTNQSVTVTYACFDNASPHNVNSGLAANSPSGSQTYTQDTPATGVNAPVDEFTVTAAGVSEE